MWTALRPWLLELQFSLPCLVLVSLLFEMSSYTLLMCRHPGVHGPRDVRGALWRGGGRVRLRPLHAGDGHLRHGGYHNPLSSGTVIPTPNGPQSPVVFFKIAALTVILHILLNFLKLDYLCVPVPFVVLYCEYKFISTFFIMWIVT